MNDRFKFRVWLEYAKLYYDLDSFYYDRPKNKYTLHFEDGHTKTIEEKDCVIEQCTGLKDKNGRLIYENDYIENDNTKDDVYLVVFDEKTARFMAKEMNGNLRLINKNVRVIGNIHEKEEE